MVVLSSMESSGSGTYLTQLVRGVYIWKEYRGLGRR